MFFFFRFFVTQENKIEPRISVPFMLELKYESKIIFNNYL